MPNHPNRKARRKQFKRAVRRLIVGALRARAALLDPWSPWGAPARLARRPVRAGGAAFARLIGSGRKLAHDPARALAFALLLLALAASPPARSLVATQSARLAEWVAACPIPRQSPPLAFDPWTLAPCYSFAGAHAGVLRDAISWVFAIYFAGASLAGVFWMSGGVAWWARAAGPLFRRARARRQTGRE